MLRIEKSPIIFTNPMEEDYQRLTDLIYNWDPRWVLKIQTTVHNDFSENADMVGDILDIWTWLNMLGQQNVPIPNPIIRLAGRLRQLTAPIGYVGVFHCVV